MTGNEVDVNVRREVICMKGVRLWFAISAGRRLGEADKKRSRPVAYRSFLFTFVSASPKCVLATTLARVDDTSV